MGYAFIEPKFIVADDAKNTHIFETWVEGGVVKIKRTSYCGKVNRKIPSDYRHFEKKGNSRNHAAELENNGCETCGTCVSTLYSDKDKNLKI